MNLRKIAKVFDKMADYVEATEREKRAAELSARHVQTDKVATAHVAAHGEEIPSDIRRKLANADPDVLSFIEGMLTKQSAMVEPLGHPAIADADEPVNTKRASADAYDTFGRWILS